VAQALQNDCTKYETGIEVIGIRVTKPRIPEGVERNYQSVEEQKTRLLVATQEQLVATKQAETLRIQAKITAEREAEVALINARREAQVETISAEKAANISRIHQTKLTEEASANAQRALIENDSVCSCTPCHCWCHHDSPPSPPHHVACLVVHYHTHTQHVKKAKALAEAENYRISQLAAGNRELLTPAYLQKVMFESVANNTKIYFGSNIPQVSVVRLCSKQCRVAC
jgi:erlin